MKNDELFSLQEKVKMYGNGSYSTLENRIIRTSVRIIFLIICTYVFMIIMMEFTIVRTKFGKCGIVSMMPRKLKRKYTLLIDCYISKILATNKW